jgi:hypothetical protein
MDRYKYVLLVEKAGDDLGESFEKKVEELCLEEGIALRKVQNDMANFQLNLQFPNPQSTINVFQPKGKNDMIMVGAVIEIAEIHRQGLRALDTKKREEFIWNLRLMLAQGTVEFELRHPDNILEFVRVHKFLYEDGFSKSIFMNALFDVNRSKLQVIWFIQKEFGVSPTRAPEEDASMYR